MGRALEVEEELWGSGGRRHEGVRVVASHVIGRLENKARPRAAEVIALFHSFQFGRYNCEPEKGRLIEP